jgi:Acetyltransferase (GNAT) family
MVRYLAHTNEPAIVAERQAHFDDHRPRHFRIVDGRTGEPVGWMAYWDRFWNDELALEMGWAVLPGFQKQDLSAAAFEAIATARSQGRARVLLATPSVDDDLANETCRRTGFSLIDTRDIELADGSSVSCNVWRQDLT